MSRRMERHKHRESRGGMELVEKRIDLKALLDTPPWDWPDDAGKQFLKVLTDLNASAPDRLIAAELAGDFTVIDEALCDALLHIVGSADEPDELRARAAIALGPVLDQCDTSDFDDPDEDTISEQKFHRIQESLHRFYLNDHVPVIVRRRILEASVRASEDWHQDAIREAYSSGNKDWMLTAVFAMRWVRGFDDQILEALESTDPEIQREAVHAAGNWELDAAWERVVGLAADRDTPKGLLLAAIGASSSIRPMEARDVLFGFTESKDEEIADAAEEASDDG